MLYVRKLFTQDLRDGKQIAFPKEPSYQFFSFDYLNGESDRSISFTFRANYEQFQEYDGKIIYTRLYASGSESRMDGEVKAFIRDELHAQVDDLLIFKNKGTKHTEYEVMFVPKSNSKYYPLLLTITGSENHTVLSFEKDLFDNELEITFPLQQIFYGAPGTGKSHEIKEKTKGYSVIRTTFHPDSDYSTFVGCYKPTMEEVGTKVVPVVVGSGISLKAPEEYKEKRITYKFVKQAFFKAYLGAWKKYVEWSSAATTATTTGMHKTPSENQLQENTNLHKESLEAETTQINIDPQFLIIEEINRGNCAQIFGDIFQLLDRQDNGFSEYPIEANTDLQQEIDRAFNEPGEYYLGLSGKINVDSVIDDYTSNYGASLSDDIQHGRILLLPSNLFIWATMNTSDQSLFPIDSAFKRRWEWKYIKIKDEKKNWKIDIEYDVKDSTTGTITKEKYDWWKFLEKINGIINNMTSSADKQLGYFFCKANKKEKDTDSEPTIITKETFVSKVLFYLWNDVFKDYGFDDASLFKYKVTEDGKETKDLTFPDFYDENGENVNEQRVREFIENVINWENKKEEGK